MPSTAAGDAGKGTAPTTTITTWPSGGTTPLVLVSISGGNVINTITPTAAAASTAANAGGAGTSSTPAIASSSASSSSGASSAGPSASNTPKPSDSSSLQPGTLAGAVVGAFIGGLLIGLAIILLVSRGRKRKQKHGFSNQPPIEMHNEVVRPKDRGLTDRHLQADSSLLSLDATSDGELAETYRKIHKLLQQHMDNFYHRQPVGVDVATLKQAAERLELVSDDVLGLEALVSLALDPRTRAAALHHIIAQVLVKSIDFNSPGSLSMLPPNLVGLVRSFPAAERGGGSFDGKHYSYFYPLVC